MDSIKTVDTVALNSVVERVLKDYVRPSFNGLMMYLSNPAQQTYGVVWLSATVGDKPPGDRSHQSHLVVLARVVGDKVVIHIDGVSDFPLLNELLRAGIPREHILLTSRGEPSLIPDHQVNDPPDEGETQVT